MIIVRPIHLRDTEAFIHFAFTANIGMTSMPKNEAALKKKVNDSLSSFTTQVISPGNESYLFVLEDLSTHEIGGSSGIIAKTGLEQPKYFFRIDQEKRPTTAAPFRSIAFLHPVCYREVPSEICSLYLLPAFRKGHWGRLLSLSRLLFIAAHPHRFDTTIYAEMRCFIDDKQQSPFWNGIGKHFCHMEYEEAIALRDQELFDMAQLLPQHPIYIPLLPLDVQQAIGNIHTNTKPAFHMLLNEGFQTTNEIDIFDGGIKIEAKTEAIRIMAERSSDIISDIATHPITSPNYIMCNESLSGFRACYSPLLQTTHGIIIPKNSAEALELQKGDVVIYASPSPELEQPRQQTDQELTS